MRTFFIALLIIISNNLQAQIWNSLGNSSVNGTVYTACIYKGNLYIGGNFTQVGTVQANNIARWNGTTWSSVGVGSNNTIYALTQYVNQTDTTLYIGGIFSSIGGVSCNGLAAYNNISYGCISTGLNTGSVFRKFYHFNGGTYIGGKFSIPMGAGNPTLKNIFKTFLTYIPGSTPYEGPGAEGVTAMCEYKNSLWIGGLFYSTNPSSLFRFENSNNGMIPAPINTNRKIYYLFGDSTYLYISSDTLQAKIGYKGFHKFNITNQVTTTIDSTLIPTCMYRYKNQMYVGGDFFIMPGQNNIKKIRKYKSGNFINIDGPDNGTIHCMLEYKNDLIVMGSFTTVNGTNIRGIAVYRDLFKPTASFTNSSDTVCQYEYITFNNTTTNQPTNIQWEFETGFPQFSSINSPTIKFNQPGKHLIKLIASNSLGVDTFKKFIYIESKPDVNYTGSTTICYGDTITLTLTGADKYNLYGSSNYSITSNKLKLYPLISESYLLEGIRNGCKDSINIATIVNSLPTPIITQQSNKLISNYQSGNKWFYNDTLLAVNSDTLNLKSSGLYKLNVIDINGCDNTTQPFQASFVSVGENNLIMNNLYYSNGLIHQVGYNYENISIYDVFFNKIYSQNILDSRTIQIDLPPGIYFAKVGYQILRFIK